MAWHAFCVLCFFSFAYGSEDTGLNVFELLDKHGIKYERHYVTTEDGYILELQRIPHRTNNTSFKGVVLMMHGILSSSIDWVGMGETSLGIILSNLGYDIWLGNARGNTWSRNHTTLDPDIDQKEFWNFSWEEIGLYDLTAKIDYITNTTGKEKIFYIGHSQGTTAFFVMASERPEYNDKIRLMTALAPIAFMNHMENNFVSTFVILFKEKLETYAEYMDLNEILPKSEFIEWLGKYGCDVDAPLEKLCDNLLFMSVGLDTELFDPKIVPLLLSNYPAGSSTKQLLHFSQEIISGNFCRYDYHDKNMEVYGQINPPDYQLDKITCPVSINYGQNDLLASVKDVERLISYLPNVVFNNKISFKSFNHIDFIWGSGIYDMLIKDVIAVMEKH